MSRKQAEESMHMYMNPGHATKTHGDWHEIPSIPPHASGAVGTVGMGGNMPKSVLDAIRNARTERDSQVPFRNREKTRQSRQNRGDRGNRGNDEKQENQGNQENQEDHRDRENTKQTQANTKNQDTRQDDEKYDEAMMNRGNRRRIPRAAAIFAGPVVPPTQHVKQKTSLQKAMEVLGVRRGKKE